MSERNTPTPPMDLDAEESVIGAMMLIGKAIDAVHDSGLRSADFYRKSHGVIYDAILSLYADGQDADPITVAARLRETGDIDKAGGPERIHELAAITPSTSNVRFKAEIVQRTSTLRALIRAGGTIQSLGWEAVGELDDVLDQAERAVYDLALSGRKKDWTPLSAAVADAYKRLEELYARGDEIIGVPSGFTGLDELTSGWQPGNLIVLAARPSMGKALSLDTKILTPSGWTTMNDIAVGDIVVGGDGQPDVVSGVYDQGSLPLYRVVFSDGAEVECCAEHQWVTTTKRERKARVQTVRTTKQMIDAGVRIGGGASRFAVPYVAPVAFEQKVRLPLDPYLVGVYLGDGDSGGNVRLSNPEEDVRERFASSLPETDMVGRTTATSLLVRRKTRNNKQTETKRLLATLGISGLGAAEKFIPTAYLFASVEDRVALLRGLCDTDGYVTDPNGSGIELVTVSRRMRDDVLFLVRSLGGQATSTSKDAYYIVNGERIYTRVAHRVVFSFAADGIIPVGSKKHLAKYRGRTRIRDRAIVNIEPTVEKPCRCITVGRGTYVVTDGFVVTHNSALALAMAAHVAVGHGQPVGLFTMEMSEFEVTQRLLGSEGSVNTQHLRNGRLSSEEWSKVTAASARLHTAPLMIDDSTATTMELRAKARRLKMRYPQLRLLIVDYLQLMSFGGKTENRVQDVSQTSRALKVLAAELDVPIVALSQLNRDVEQRHDKRPILSDLRESGSIEQDADLVLFVYRDEYYHPEDTDQQGIAEVNVAKHRNGPTGTVKLAFVARYAAFHNLMPTMTP